MLNRLLFIFILSINLVVAKAIDVNVCQSGLSIFIDKPDYKFSDRSSLAGNSISSHEKINNYISISDRFSETCPDSTLCFGADKFVFIIATPDANLPEIKILNIKSSKIAPLDASIARCDGFSDYSVTCESAGKLRGINLVKVIIQPVKFSVSDNSILAISKAEIAVIFSSQISVDQNPIAPNELGLFAAVANQEHLPTLLNDYKNKKRESLGKSPNRLLSAGFWMKDGLDYFQINTSKDGIASISMSDLISASPSLAGKPVSKLILINNAIKYPYIIPNNNGKISNGDYLYFFGKHPHGDSTYNDFYAKYEVFYLYYDSSDVAVNLNLRSTDINPVSTLNSVYAGRHIEKDSAFILGFSIGETWKSIGKDWYSKTLDQMSDSVYSTLINVWPSDDINDNLNFSLNFVAGEDSVFWKPFSRYVCPDKTIDFSINDDFLAKKSYTNFIVDTVNLATDPSGFFLGKNVVRVKLEKNFFNINTSHVDYFNFSGKQLPIADNGSFIFKVSPQPNDSKTIVSGFEDKSIFGIDTVNSEFVNLPSESGFFVASSSRNNPSFTSIRLNGQYYSSWAQGVHVLACMAPDYKVYINRYFQNPDNTFIQFIDSLPDATALVFCINTGQPLANEFVNYINKYGNSKLNLYPSDGKNCSYTAAILKNQKFIDISPVINGISKLHSFIISSNGKSYQCSVPIKSARNEELFLNDGANIEQCALIAQSKSDLHNSNNEADYLIIYHPDFIVQAKRLAEHRNKFNSIKTKIVDINDIYKEFSFGKLDPHAIRSFLAYTLNSWKLTPTHVLLFGDASFDLKGNDKKRKFLNYIPAFGFPTSDSWYTFINKETLPEFAIGRVPAFNSSNAENMINKIIEYDTVKAAPWMKKVLMITGGDGDYEKDVFYNDMLELSQFFIKKTICCDTFTIQKHDNSVVGISDAGLIMSQINDGRFWVNFSGHGSTEGIEVDGWFSYLLANKSKYFILSTLSCNTSSYAEPEVISKNETYLLEKDKGAVATLGSSCFLSNEVNSMFIDKAISGVSDSSLYLRDLGSIVNYGKMNFTDNYYFTKAFKYVFNILGDPFTKIRMANTPDYYFVENDLKFTNLSGSSIISETDDSLLISGTIANYGVSSETDFIVNCIHEAGDKSDTLRLFINQMCKPQKFSFIVPINKTPGFHKITLLIDPTKRVRNEYSQNNKFVKIVDVYAKSLLKVDPLDNWIININDPKFRYLNPIDNGEIQFDYQFIISDVKDTNQSLYISQSSDIIIKKEYIEFQPPFKFEAGKLYWVRACYINKDNKSNSNWIWTSFIPVNNALTENNSDFTINKVAQMSDWKLNSIDNTSLNDSLSSQIKFDNQDFRIFGVVGKENLLRYGFMRIGSDIVVNSVHAVGLNAVIFNSKTGKWRYNEYRTWDEINSSRNFIKFIRDSSDEWDYVGITTCEQSFNVPMTYLPKTDPGSMDSLIATLKLFGAGVADSLQFNTSYSLLGWRGASKDMVFEAINQDRDTANITGNLMMFNDSANIESSLIGPAKKWNNISFIIDNINSTYPLNIKIYAVNPSINENLLISDLNGMKLVDLSAIDATIYPFIKVKFNFYNNAKSLNEMLSRKKAILKSILCNFAPVPEYAFVESASVLSDSGLIRGDDLKLKIGVQNISPRSSSDSSDFRLKITDPTDVALIDSLTEIKAINKNELIQIPVTFDTKDFAVFNTLNIAINTHPKYYEMYNFNNYAKAYTSIIKDTSAPQMTLYMDGIKIDHDGIDVSMNPLVEVKLDDAAHLVLNSSQLGMRAQINGVYQDSSKSAVNNYIYKTYDKYSLIKASLSFISHTPETGENWIKVYGTDASNNHDTVFYHFNVPKAGIASDLKNFPNPADYKTTINFSYKSPTNHDKGNIKIYNIFGEFVRELAATVNFGENNIEWNCFDHQGNLVPQGVYFYFLNIDNGYYVPTLKGKMMICR
ncbi:MAG: C25 family cysteine peptidase [Candidatus Kapabacteria bacterium]|nr:C25 family cysteine peptidase [Candidatus Kapabacteria bacterium]